MWDRRASLCRELGEENPLLVCPNRLPLPRGRGKTRACCRCNRPLNWKTGETYRLLDLRQMCMASAAAMSSSRNWGAATEIRPSARSQVVLPLTLNIPCSVTT